MKRAYSVLQIKSFDEDSREFEGIATTPTVDSYGDIVEPEGAEFDLPIPFLWQHNAHQPIGHITEAKVSKDEITVKGNLVKSEEPGTLKDRLDEAWQSMKLGLVRGLSIGFRPIEHAFMEGSNGIHFMAWKWLELSAVTIPANSDASIQAIKSIDSEVRAALGKKPEGSKSKPGVTGIQLKGKTMNIQEQIQGFEEARKEKAARMSEIMEKSAEKGETLDAELTEEYDNLEAEVESIDKHLKRLKSLDKLNQEKAEPVGDTPNAPGQSSRDPMVRATAKPPLLKDGLALAQFAKFVGLSKGNEDKALRMAKNDSRTDRRVVGVLKAAVEAGTTDSDSWAGALVGEETSLFADFVEFLRPQTIIGRIPNLRTVPFRVPLIGQTDGGEGYWTGEAKAKGLTKFDFERKTLEPLKVANIAVVTDELLRNSSPSADALIRDQLVAAIRHRLDADFINPGKAAVSGVSPASITNGITPTPSSGNGEDDVRDDIKAMFAGFIAANNAPSNGVWIMSNTTALSLSLMHNALGNRVFPDVNMDGGVLWGLPVVASEHVPSDSNGHFVVLVNASDIYLGDEGGFRVDMTDQASLQMDDDPGHDSDTPTAAQLVSLWQTNSVAFRAERIINWMRRRDSAVQVLSGVNWGDAESG